MGTMSQSYFKNMTDGPGMVDQGLLKLQRISGDWKTQDGSFELRLRSQEAVAILHGRGALDTRVAVDNLMSGFMGLAMQTGGSMPQQHEIDLIFSFGHTILDVEGTPLLRLERAWYDNGALTVEVTDRQTDAKRALRLARVPAEEQPVDPSIPVPRFCPECGHPMNGKPICQSCGWRVTG